MTQVGLAQVIHILMLTWNLVAVLVLLISMYSICLETRLLQPLEAADDSFQNVIRRRHIKHARGHDCCLPSANFYCQVDEK